MKFILRWLATAVAVAVVIWLIPGVDILGGSSSWGAIIIFAAVLALINMSIRPLLQILSLPISILTLGIFYLIVNTFMLYVASWIANGIFQTGFIIDSFGSAFVASVVISIITFIINGITGANDKKES
ncbi:MAG: phage holin family protein [Raoultibacter sp.]